MAARRVVVVAGAGASRELGAGEDMPLMSNWATSLRNDIESQFPGASDVIGLKANMAGDDFETYLGRFLALQTFMPELRRLLKLGFSDRQSDPGGYAQAWLTTLDSSTDAIVEIIRTNLFRTFGPQNIDAGKAAAAYASIFDWLGNGRSETHVSFATTNYDHAIEMALADSVHTALDGFANGRISTAQLDVSQVVQRSLASPLAVPVLHLHGAVGWYRDSNGLIRSLPADLDYLGNYRTPALLLPDSTKTATSLSGGEGLWGALKELLEHATHVLFLGHSLHDKHLIELVAGYRLPTGVLYYSSDPMSGGVEAQREAEDYVREYMPKAEAILCHFRPFPLVDGKRLESWLKSGDPQGV